ncbi:MAG: TatD family hydrolase [Candidatus Goldiibacteriota bacterium]|jgi:TatD DNase family protein
MIVETHVHLCDEKYDGDRQETLARAAKAGVVKFLNVSAELKEIRKIAALEINGVYKAFGLHPHNTGEFSDEVYGEIKGYFKAQKNAVAVGEIGLDYFRSTTSRADQENVFRKFLGLADQLNLPVVIHSREAHDDVIKILKKYDLQKKGIIHCFTGGAKTAAQFLDMGFVLGIGGVVTFPNTGELAAAVRNTPLDSIVLETDAPWLAPQPFRGKRNEPAYLKEIAKMIAGIKGTSAEKVEEITAQTAARVLNI